MTAVRVRVEGLGYSLGSYFSFHKIQEEKLNNNGNYCSKREEARGVRADVRLESCISDLTQPQRGASKPSHEYMRKKLLIAATAELYVLGVVAHVPWQRLLQPATAATRH